MSRLMLSKKLKIRLENVDNESIIFCYDERINEYFAMDAKYYDALKLLEAGVCEKELTTMYGNSCDLLLRGLRYRKLLFEIEGEQNVKMCDT